MSGGLHLRLKFQSMLAKCTACKLLELYRQALGFVLALERDRQTDRNRETETDRQTDRQIDR